MKKRLVIAICALILILGGEAFYLHQQNAASRPSHPRVTKVKPYHHIKQPKQRNNNKVSSPSSSSSKLSSSAKTSSQSSQASSSAQSSSRRVNTGNAGKHGAGKMGNHQVNGQAVSQSTLSQIKSRLTALGYDASSWSPQDMINLWRFASGRGVTSPAAISRQNVQQYLKP